MLVNNEDFVSKDVEAKDQYPRSSSVVDMLLWHVLWPFTQRSEEKGQAFICLLFRLLPVVLAVTIS